MAAEVYDLVKHYNGRKPSVYHARGIVAGEVLNILRGDLGDEMEPDSWEILPHDENHSDNSSSHLSNGSN